MRITSNGFIGIGISTPQSLLHIHNLYPLNDLKLCLTDGNTEMNINRGFAIIKNSDKSCKIWNYENSSISLGTNNSEKITILSNGNIGIGITNPIEKFELVSGNFKTNGIIQTYSLSNNSNLNIQTSTSNDIILITNNTEKMRITSSGNIGIGTNNPINKFEIINGAINTNDYKFNNNSLFQYIPANTQTFINGTIGNINETFYYIQFINNGTLTIPTNIYCDCLIVGAGGRGGIGPYSGGGGAGEVIYYPSLYLTNGNYNINIGIDSSNILNRISKVTNILTNEVIITAKGGGDGGYWDGLAKDEIIRRFPSKIYNRIGTKQNQIFNNCNCIKNTFTLTSNDITFGSGDYDYWYSSEDTNNTNEPYNIFNFNDSISDTGTILKNGNYDTNTGNLTDQGNNYSFFNDYKGDWICIKLPIYIILKSYLFIQRQGYVHRAPKNYKIYASINGSNWITLTTVTNAVYTNYIHSNALNNNETPYLYYCLTVNSIIGLNSHTGSAPLNFNQWILNGQQIKIIQNSSGGSGGGGYGNPYQTQLNQIGGNIGEPFNLTYSKLTPGYNGTSIKGGNGGSALISGRYTEIITGQNIQVGGGGIGAAGETELSAPAIKTFYGDGGDGNSGLGFNGIIIFRFSSQFITKFLQYTDWNKLLNINIGSGLKIDTINNNILSSVWTSNDNKIYNNTATNIGINTTNPICALDIIGSINITSNHNDKTYFKLTNNNVNNNSLVLFEFNNGNGNANISLFSKSSIINTPNKLLIENNIPNGDIEIKSSNSSFILKADNGNIGIGISNPTEKLDLGFGNLKTYKASII